ncbi:MAG: alpha/beta fold hydrolase [Clostridia bacterium]|nr:alpha/beta fold hydrolase [Clostridia bacterium]MBQ6703931.1 alpha/beta fold hydrolase [Clostridia bacterium]
MTAVIIIAAALLILCIGAVYAVYRVAFYSPRGNQNDIHNLPTGEQYDREYARMRSMVDRLAAIPYERVSILSNDGLRLQGMYYHVKDGAPLDIGFHGYRSTAIRDFCGGAIMGMEAGHNVLLVKQRGCCDSEGHTITFGVKERQDCLSWINYAIGRFGADTQIVLYGVSMGAATVLCASGMELPDNVKGIIADSPFSSPISIIETVAASMGIPRRAVRPLATAAARIFGGFDLHGTSALEAVSRAKTPLLIIHGEDDRFVPCDMGREIYGACPEGTELVTFPMAGHAISYLMDEPRYKTVINAFWKRVYEN